MAVYRVEIAYDGAPYHGWQIQPNVPTIQGKVNAALTHIFGTPIHVGGASRTDAGVHAVGQVVSFAPPEGHRHMGRFELQRALNALLPDDISALRTDLIHELDHADRPFHARHCARGKIYSYRLWFNRIEDPFARRTHWAMRHPADEEVQARIKAAAERMLGTHDFAGFRASSCEAEKTVRHLYRVELIPPAAGHFSGRIIVQGTAFLKNMVRIIVGTLMDVGYGRIPPERIDQILQTGDRTLAGRTAPPHGLFLEEVFYPDFPWTQERWSSPPR